MTSDSSLALSPPSAVAPSSCAQGDRRQEDLVADAAAFQHDAILERRRKRPDSVAIIRAGSPGATARSGRVRAHRRRVTDAAGPAAARSRCTPSWIWALEAGPWAAIVRLTSAGASAMTVTLALARGQADHAPGVRHQERGPGELVIRVEILERHQRGRVLGEDVGDRVEDLMDADLQRGVGTGDDDAGVGDHRPTPPRLDERPAGTDEPGIDPQDPHADRGAASREVKQPRWPR